MNVAWLAPATLVGVALVALPIAIHLLTRQQARTQPFPSLRFLLPTQLAALRRRTIEDLGLLAVRVLIVALAALALAGPVLQGRARVAAGAARLSRAVVLIGATPAEPSAKLREGVFQFASFHRAAVADAIADAVFWLNAQPASAREVVLSGELRRGDVDEGDLRMIPPEIGVRFESMSSASPGDVTSTMLARRNGVLVRVDRLTHLDTDMTRVADGEPRKVPADTLTILAGNQPLAVAALNAVLDVGVPWRDFDRKVVVAWEDADAGAVAKAANSGAIVVPMAVPQPAAASADALMRVLREVSPLARIDPVQIPGARLKEWSRTPGAVSTAAPLADEGDRRWVWLAVVVLLIIEWRLRQQRGKLADTSATGDAEVRVA